MVPTRPESRRPRSPWFASPSIAAVLLLPLWLAPVAPGQSSAEVAPMGGPILAGLTADLILVFEDGREEEGRSALDALGGTGRVDLQNLPITRVVLDPAGYGRLATVPHLVGVTPNLPLQFLLDESTAAIGATEVWDTMGELGRNATVLVIDSGVDGTHPDLNAVTSGALVDVAIPVLFNESVNLVAKSHVLDSYASLGPHFPLTDSVGHGTHVASTIAGRGLVPLPGNDPSQGLTERYRGVAPEAHVASFGLGAGLFVLGALQGFDYALGKQDELGIRVISNSWGPLCQDPVDGAWTCTSDPASNARSPVAVAARKAYEAGMVVVFAAGNDGSGSNTMNPYSLPPWVLSAAATTKDRVLAGFSSRGAPGKLTHNHPDLAAPGVSIMAARSSGGWLTALGPLYCEKDPGAGYPAPLTGLSSQSPENIAAEPFYQCMSGTSMATPHVSGVAALVASANPALSPDQIMDILAAAADPLPQYQAYQAGTGFLNAKRAVELARSTPGDREAFLEGARAYSGGLLNEGKGDFAKDSSSRAWYALHPHVDVKAPTQNQKLGLPAGQVTVEVDSYAESWGLDVTFALDGGVPEVILPDPATGLYARTWQFGEITDGSHTVLVRATTGAGGATEVQRAFLVDAAPVCSFVSPLPGATLRGTVGITAHWADSPSPFSTAELWVDGAQALSYGPPDGEGVLAGNLDTRTYADQAHTLQLRCRDAEGRLGTKSGSFGVNNQLLLMLHEPIGGATVSGLVPLRVQADSTRGLPTSVDYSVDGAPWQGLTGPSDGTSYTGLWDSTAHTEESVYAQIQVRGVPAEGPSTTVSVQVWVDNELAPTVEILAPVDGGSVVGVQRILVAAASNRGDALMVEVNLHGGRAGAWIDITSKRDGESYYYDWITTFDDRDAVVVARATDGGGASLDSVRVQVIGYFWVLDNSLTKPFVDYSRCIDQHLFGEPFDGKPLDWGPQLLERVAAARSECQLWWA